MFGYKHSRIHIGYYLSDNYSVLRTPYRITIGYYLLYMKRRYLLPREPLLQQRRVIRLVHAEHDGHKHRARLRVLICLRQRRACRVGGAALHDMRIV